MSNQIIADESKFEELKGKVVVLTGISVQHETTEHQIN